MEDEGEASSASGRVEMSGEGDVCENSSREDSKLAEDTSIEQQGDASVEKLTEPEVATSHNPGESTDASEKKNFPTFTSGKRKPELEDLQEANSIRNDERGDSGGAVHKSESTPIATTGNEGSASATRDAEEDPVQEVIEAGSFVGTDDQSERSPADDVSEASSSFVHVSRGGYEERSTPQLEDKESSSSSSLEKECESVVMEIAERLSQLRSIGKSAESARKYNLEPPDANMEEVDLDNDMSSVLGPKRLDFEVIDFDQFGVQPPDLPLSEDSKHEGKKTKLNHGMVSLHGKNVGVVLEQGMKELHDNPKRTSSKEPFGKKQLRKDQENKRDLESRLSIGKNLESRLSIGSSKPRPLESTMKLKKVNESTIGSPIRKSSNKILVTQKSSPIEETPRRHIHVDLNQLIQKQARQLDAICNRVDLSTAQLKEQSKRHEEFKLKLDVECGERLQNEVKMMELHEILPTMEDKLKSLYDQVSLLKVQFEEQIDLKNKLEEQLKEDHKEKIHLFVQMEKEIDVRNKLVEDLQNENKERALHSAQLEQQIRLHEALEHKLEEERIERWKSDARLMVLFEMLPNMEKKMGEFSNQIELLIVQLHGQIKFVKELEEKLDQECRNGGQLMTKLEEQKVTYERLVHKQEEEMKFRKELEEKVDQKCMEKMQYVVEIEEQKKLHEELRHQLKKEIELRKELEEKLNEEFKLHTINMKNQNTIYKELAQKLEEEQQERLKCEINMKGYYERLSNKDEQLKEIQDHVKSLGAQLQEQIELRRELLERLDQDWENRRESDAMVSKHSMAWLEERLEFAKFLEEQKVLLANQMKEAGKQKNVPKKKVRFLHHVNNLEVPSNITKSADVAVNAKDQAIKQVLWTLFQALGLGIGLLYFIVSYNDHMLIPLQPT
ncbi:uncharacterized protein [Physcomitrium patens]|uniref:Uncharacterized protein n=1 Tax=Physcomitrium patens TaxID=3218 RepID=A0A2K1K869_PHYPA|nr:cingulin-like isoform X2 [Physcomitrium patens]PNR49970.1 hypothetical protein PHYPA_011867 [Physcomitrium patens]|eukprot:XP_024381967.1 cingulin-like isoform X2 [Physcomitrella patens]